MPQSFVETVPNLVWMECMSVTISTTGDNRFNVKSMESR